MIASVLAGTFGAGALLIGIANRVRCVPEPEARAMWLKYFSYAGIVGGILLSSQWRAALIVVLIAVGALCIREVLRVRAYWAAAWVMASVWFALSADKFLLMYLVVAANDAFAQLGGRLARGPRLLPTLSPQKTISGALCGILAAIVVGHFVGLRLDAAAGLAVAGLAGDLAASRIKRHAGVKDFGHALPGHGGFMDRFDSLWGAAPIGALLC